MVGGSHAAMYYGEPRLTRDIDVVVTLQRQIRPVQYHPPGSGLQIDVYVNPDTPYDRVRLARRQKLPLAPGVDAYFARPEDVILYKLLYAREGGEIHLRDVLGIIRVSGPDLDERYVVEWADRLGLRGVWERVRRQAG